MINLKQELAKANRGPMTAAERQRISRERKQSSPQIRK